MLKVLADPGQAVDSSDLWYWKREWLANQSGLLAGLPGPVTAPRCYGVVDQPKSGWIWMEHIVAKSDRRWTTAEYAFAAHQAGCFNAAYLSGLALPDHPWLCRAHTRGWLNTIDSFPDIWANNYIQHAFPAPIKDRVLRLLDAREGFFAALDRLPQVFSHFDYMRRNLIIRSRTDGKDETVALDWALCGIGAAGSEIATLIGSSALLCELLPPELEDTEAAALSAYITGLRDGGCEANPDLIRLGYAAWLGLWCGAAMPALVAWWTQPENLSIVERSYGCSVDEFVAREAVLCEFALDRADEARRLM